MAGRRRRLGLRKVGTRVAIEFWTAESLRMKLPGPRERLADCMWLRRIIHKARAIRDGRLPGEYVDRFCHPGGVDGQFLLFFSLEKPDIVKAAELSDLEVEKWFRKLNDDLPERIEAWNRIAENMGRAGFPMAERMPIALATTYQHLAHRAFATVFEILEADEAND